MHIPDGFLSAGVCVATAVGSGASVALMARRAQAETEESRAPLLGVMGAFVFAAQMINFPVGAGTTGHLLGGVLLAIILGPASAVVVMTAILAVQALIFQDGGVLALGANIFNMAVVGVLVGYLPFRLLTRTLGRSPSVFAGAFLSVLTSAVLAIGELRLSGINIPGAVLGVSMGLFAINGVLEGAITVGVVRALEALHPGSVRQPPPRTRRAILAATAVAALLLAVAAVWIASPDPDGLERLAERLEIASRARALVPAPLVDYHTRIIAAPWLSGAAAGVAGLILVFGIAAAIGRLQARKKGA
jgi:cobalt/nickel transport system permease protein